MSVKQITVGQDSFLDIVANLVGVLIILIVVIGAQAKTAWDPAQPETEVATAPQEILQKLSLAADQVRKLEIDNAQLENQILRESSVVAGLSEARHRMLVQIEMAERQLAEQKLERRQQLDAQQQAELERLEETEDARLEIGEHRSRIAMPLSANHRNRK